MEKNKKNLIIDDERHVRDILSGMPFSHGFYGVEVDTEIDEYSDQLQGAEVLFQES